MKKINIYDENNKVLAEEEIPYTWTAMKIKSEMYKKYPKMKYYE
jgi:hypothetical protein